MSYEIMSSDVLDWMDYKGVSRATLIGHSMGGKVAMAAARSERGRERLEGLAVIDIAPVEYEPGDGSMWEVIERVIEACEGLDLEQVATKVEANRKLKEGGVEDTNLRGFCCTNLEKDESGKLRWKVNLPSISSNLSQIAGFKSSTDSPYPGDTYFIAGGNSKYVRVRDVPKITEMFPRMMITTVRGVGHWVHAESPTETLELLQKYLSRDKG